MLNINHFSKPVDYANLCIAVYGDKTLADLY